MTSLPTGNQLRERERMAKKRAISEAHSGQARKSPRRNLSNQLAHAAIDTAEI